MPWTPASTLLLTTDELKNFSKSISYTTELGISEPVTITALDTNDTVNVSGNKISGYFSDSFLNSQIQYRTVDDTFVNVSKFTEINTAELSELIYFKPDPAISETYSYLATSTTASQTYTILVTNNWSVGRYSMLKYIGLNLAVSISWINTSGNIVGWTNSSGQTIDWIKIS